MAGIYIHIPFCKKACHYCNFHFSTQQQRLPQMVNAIVEEAFLRKDYLQQQPVETIYFGGGTPSLCSDEGLEKMISTMRNLFDVAANAEITLEANPDDITENKLLAWKKIGINRLSIGIQSFVAEDLIWMNRAHTAEQAIASIQLAQLHGFNNITIDLIYGTPTLTDAQWRANVATALALNIAHISCYALTVEPKTALATMIEKQRITAVDSNKQAHHFELLMQWMHEAGFEHYEISNFAKPNHRSRHNSSYWQNKWYLGLGPSAHSFNGTSRQWNIANNALYINSIEKNSIPSEIEILTPTQQLNEYIMTSLRTMEGISLNFATKQWGEVAVNELLHRAKNAIWQGYALHQNNQLQLTTKGKLLADGIAADLFA